MMQPNQNQQNAIQRMAQGAGNFMNNMNQGYQSFVNSDPSKAYIAQRNRAMNGMGNIISAPGRAAYDFLHPNPPPANQGFNGAWNDIVNNTSQKKQMFNNIDNLMK